MALAASGELALSEISTEFGGVAELSQRILSRRRTRPGSRLTQRGHSDKRGDIILSLPGQRQHDGCQL